MTVEMTVEVFISVFFRYISSVSMQRFNFLNYIVDLEVIKKVQFMM